MSQSFAHSNLRIAQACCLLTLWAFTSGFLVVPLLYADLIGLRMDTIGLHSSWFFGMSSLAMALGPVYGALCMQVCKEIVFFLLVCWFSPLDEIILYFLKNTFSVDQYFPKIC